MAKLDEIQEGVTEINERSAPRAIREQDANAMIRVLSQQPPQNVIIYFLMANEEARRLAESIRAILLAAGWQCEELNSKMPFSRGPLPGIQVYSREKTGPGLILLNAIADVGLHVEGTLRENLPTNTRELNVFGKP